MRPLRFRAVATTALSALLLAGPVLTTTTQPAAAQFALGIGLHINIAPPILPVYEPPPLPAPGYIFQPGYWAYGDAGYYWVPGTWILPPQPGLLWTPGYWGWNNGLYVFNGGYWGPHIGYYGGINYGFGYNGVGFFGGEWRGGVFAYNRAAYGEGFGAGVHITNVYNQTYVHVNDTHVAFNGPGGVVARPTPQQEAFAHEQHIPPTAAQLQHREAAARDPAFRASVNHGVPAIAAVARPAEFHGPGVVPARAAAAEAHTSAVQAHTAAAEAHTAAVESRAAHPAPMAHSSAMGHPTPMAHPAATPHAYAPHTAMQPREHAMAPHAMAAPRSEAPRAEAPRAEVHRAEAPRAEAPRAEAPRPMAAPRPAPRPAPHPEGRKEEHPRR